MYNIMLLVKNGFRLALRKKFVLLSMILFPVLATFLVLLGNNSGSEIIKSTVMVISDAPKVYTDAVVNTLNNDSSFNIMTEKRDGNVSIESQCKNLADNSTCNFYVYLPSEIENKIKSDESIFKVLFAGKDQRINILKSRLTATGLRIRSFYKLSKGNHQKFENLIKTSENDTPRVSSTSASFQNTNSDVDKDASGRFTMVIGFLSWFAIWGSSYVMATIIQERDLKVFKRVLLTNTSFFKYFLSKLILGLIIGIIQVGLMMISFKYIVHTDQLVNIWQLGVVLFGFILVAICINLAVVSFCETEQQVSMISLIIVNISAMVSGSYWPYEIMPEWMKNVSYFMPQRWMILTIKKMADDSINALTSYGLVIAGFVIFLSVLTVLGFRLKAYKNA